MSVKWTMIDSRTFIGEKDGYQISIKDKAAFGYAYWAILKDGVIITDCYRHPVLGKGELNGKVQSERILNRILAIDSTKQ